MPDYKEIEELVNRYLELDAVILRTGRGGNLRTALGAATESLPLLPAVVESTKLKYGRFDLQESVAVRFLGWYLSGRGDVVGLSQLRDFLAAMPELIAWADSVSKRIGDAHVANAIRGIVAASPGTLQSSLDAHLRRDAVGLGRIVVRMAEVGRLTRTPSGDTFALFVSESTP